jgi:DNA-binding transcriptional regulator GbsR (MarR family)
MSPDSQLEELLRILIDRFGGSRTLGEVYANTYALHMARDCEEFTLADIAEKTGVSKQNLSRWLKQHVETGYVAVQPHYQDDRRKSISISNLDYACRHLPSIARVFDSSVDPAREQRIDRI